MSFSTIFHIVATAFWAVAAALAVTHEPDFLSLTSLDWAIFGLPFHGAGHWVTGSFNKRD